MKSDMNRRYHTRVITNIIYSAIISCLVEIFLVTNVSMIARYMEESGRMNGLIQAVLGYHVAVVLVYVISGLVLFAVTFMILQEPYIRYISKISDAVQSISEGNLNTTIDVIGDDEFSSMAANLNKMVEDIRVLMDKERESERTKNELITNVAHDLRTPLTSIYGSSSTLLSKYDELPKEQQLKLLGEIREDSEWLIRMVENLLSVTRIDGAKVEVVKTPTVLDELIDSVLMKFSKKHPNQKVITQIPDEFVDIPMDSLLIEQVLLNLLENAVFHAKGMTELMLSVSLVGDKAVFEVADNGCGIPEDALQKIFSGSYEKSAAPVDGTRSNMGIGLSVCVAIVKAHGSDITAENRKGGGAVFRFALERGGEDDGQ